VIALPDLLPGLCVCLSVCSVHLLSALVSASNLFLLLCAVKTLTLGGGTRICVLSTYSKLLSGTQSDVKYLLKSLSTAFPVNHESGTCAVCLQAFSISEQ